MTLMIGVLAPIAVVLYRLAAAQLKALLELVLRRLDAIQHMLTDLNDGVARLQRWQSRVDRRLERLEARQQYEAAEVVE